MKLNLNLLVLVVFGFMCICQAFGKKEIKSEYKAVVETARREIWRELSSGNASSAMTAIMINGKIVYSEEFGMRDRLASIPVDSNTQFNIGSISKVFTAFAVLSLVDQGKIELDKPVTSYLSDFRMPDERYKQITVRMLVNHTSAFPGSNYKEGFGIKYNPNYLTQTLEYLADGQLNSQPGEISVYCNDGFTMAELIVERVSGLPFADYLKKHIFDPCGMSNSSCSYKPGNKNIAIQYDSKTGRALPIEIGSIMGSGGLASTATDLCKFATVLHQNKLLSSQSLGEYTKEQYGPKTALNGRPEFNCGLGWDCVGLQEFAEQGVRVLAKNGGTLEFSSQLYVIPKEKIAVALIFCGRTDVGKVASKITQSLLECLNLVPKKSTIHLPLRKGRIPDALSTFAGFYAASGVIEKISFDKEKDVMELAVWDGKTFAVKKTIPYKVDGFFHDENSRYTFKRFENNDYFVRVFGDALTADWVTAERIKPISDGKWNGNEFAVKTWLVENLTADEFGGDCVKTGLIPSLPGYIYVSNEDGMSVYRLAGKMKTEVCLKYARDQLAPSIIERHGKKYLKTGNYRYVEKQKLPQLLSDSAVILNSDDENVWRQIGSDCILSGNIPPTGRIMIFTPTFKECFDSLMGETLPVTVSAGNYICFIGPKGTQFNLNLGK